MSLLTIDNLTCSYGHKSILSDFSMKIPKGQIVGLIGANGSGKTTLLKCIGGVIPYIGSITLYEGDKKADIKSFSHMELAKKISYIPQVSGISIDISCLDVVLMGVNPMLGILEKPGNLMISRAKDLLVIMGLEEYIYSNYQELSQGQKQLCLLARTLIGSATLLLLDEPESSLDFAHRHEFIKHIRGYIDKDKSALVTLHDPQLALNFCDRIMVIHNKHCMAEFEPSKKTEQEIEGILSKIYGPIRIDSYRNYSGQRQLVINSLESMSFS